MCKVGRWGEDVALADSIVDDGHAAVHVGFDVARVACAGGAAGGGADAGVALARAGASEGVTTSWNAATGVAAAGIIVFAAKEAASEGAAQTKQVTVSTCMLCELQARACDLPREFTWNQVGVGCGVMINGT